MSADEEQFDGFNEATNGGDASQANTRQQPVVPPRRSARTTRHLWYRPRTAKGAAKQELSRAGTSCAGSVVVVSQVIADCCPIVGSCSDC